MVEGDEELLAAAEDRQDPPAPFKYSTIAERNAQRHFIGTNDDPVKVWHKLREYTIGIHGPDVPELERLMMNEYYSIEPRRRFRPPPHPETGKTIWALNDHDINYFSLRRMLTEPNTRNKQAGMYW